VGQPEQGTGPAGTAGSAGSGCRRGDAEVLAGEKGGHYRGHT